MAVEQPDFEQVFASCAAEGDLSTMPAASYLRGWGYLNVAEPVPRVYFNYLQNLLDRRLTYLFAAERLRQNSTEYDAGEAVRCPELSTMYMLVCVSAGTTASSEPDFSGAAEGTEITDGTCVWQVRRVLERAFVFSDSEPAGQIEGDVWIEEE